MPAGNGSPIGALVVRLVRLKTAIHFRGADLGMGGGKVTFLQPTKFSTEAPTPYCYCSWVTTVPEG